METDYDRTKDRTVELGFKKEEVNDLVSTMNDLLADYQIHYQKLRNFHWNVKGPDFFELHEQFEKEYKEVHTIIDQLAERIRVFGARPLSTFKEYLTQASIREQSERFSSEEMVLEVIEDFEALLTRIVTALELASKAGDSATHQLLTSWAERLEKRHWMFNAWLGN